jgi:glycosyltransferase involved in cell wall biosynthesis
MTRRKVLIVCMFDSIHAGRWLSQFIDQEIDFILFPSKKFKKIHPKLITLLNSQSSATFKAAHFINAPGILGYLDFLFFVQASRILRKSFRMLFLRKLIATNDFDFVHALEIQGAGYICDEAIKEKNFKFILTNWGSDIFYFQHLPDHLPRIKSALTKADLYSAECKRDYKLAIDLGFTGEQLPCIPNGGGLINNETIEIGIPTSSRSNIVVKSYGGTFGRGELAIEAVAKIMMENRELTAFFFSVTDDLLSKVEAIKNIFKTRVSYSTLKNPISHKKLEDIFSKSRIYIGCSISDGISTSFLEALANGVYPIQTNSSCAEEWVKKGAQASLIELDYNELFAELSAAVKDDKRVDAASKANRALVEESLEFSIIKDIALQFYSFSQETLQT